MRKGTHVSSVPLSWRRSGLLLQASGRCSTSSWTRLLGVENSFKDRFDPVTPSMSSGNTRLSAASSRRSYLLQCLSVGVCRFLLPLEHRVNMDSCTDNDLHSEEECESDEECVEDTNLNSSLECHLPSGSAARSGSASSVR
ncbi:hypothetical protein MRX96_013627 [Rhipicephalus microplus]